MAVPPYRPVNGPSEPVAGATRQLPRTVARARRQFLAMNGAAFLLTALSSATAGELFATRPASGMPLGVVLGALQLTVLLLTSWWYDRTLRRHADPLVDLIRRHAGLAHPSPPRPGPAAMSGWPYSSQGRRG